MKPFSISIFPELPVFGAVRVLSGTLDETDYIVGGAAFTLPEGIVYDLLLTNTGEAILLTGTVKAKAQTECDRCLAPVTFDVAGEVEGYYLLEQSEDVEGYERDEFEVISSDGSFDIAPAIQAALVYATPFVIVCKDDCKGLCPHCGADLNEGPCSCGADGIDPLNPFSMLSGMDLDDE